MGNFFTTVANNVAQVASSVTGSIGLSGNGIGDFFGSFGGFALPFAISFAGVLAIAAVVTAVVTIGIIATHPGTLSSGSLSAVSGSWSASASSIALPLPNQVVNIPTTGVPAQTPGITSASVPSSTLTNPGASLSLPNSVSFSKSKSSSDCGDKPSTTSCNKAIKLLSQVERLGGKLQKSLSGNRLKELTTKRDNGTITSYDLPGGIQSEFPGEFKGLSLSEIKKICKG